MKKSFVVQLLITVLALSLLGASCTPATQPPGGGASAEPSAGEPAPAETKDWPVYQHQGPDYSVQYPIGWHALASQNPTMSDLEFLTLSTATEEFTPTDCSFGVKTWDSDLIGDKQVAKDRATETGTVEIDGVTAEKYVFAPNNEYFSHAHFLTKDSYWYSLTFHLKKDKPAEPCLAILNNILKTFKFGR